MSNPYGTLTTLNGKETTFNPFLLNKQFTISAVSEDLTDTTGTLNIHWDNLLASFRMENNLDDDSGNNFNGTPKGTNPITYEAGKTGFAAKFNGANYIDLGPTNSIIGDNATIISVSAWFKTSMSARGYIISLKRTHTFDIDSSLFGIYTEDGKVCLISFNNSHDITCTTKDIYNNNNWHHIVATTNNTKRKLYIDGRVALEDDFTLEPNFQNTNHTTVGIFSKTSDYPRDFIGLIDSLSIWNKALTESEVINLYNAGN